MIRVLANLDCEARWAGRPLRQHVLRKISAIASLTAVLVDDDHGGVVEVWAPAAVDPTRLVRDVTWPRVVMRVADPGVDPRSFDVVWAAPDAKPFNDRRFAVEIARRASLDEAGIQVVTSVDELERVAIAISGPWVAKAVWSTAGRDRVLGIGAPTGEQRVYLARLLDGPGALVVEPWRERLVDVGTCAHVTRDGQVRVESPHTLLVDARGGFAGIDVARPPVEPHEHDTIVAAVTAAGEALATAGYRGPYAVDSFVYLDHADRRVRAIVEINARHTFGHVARALAARSGPPRSRLGFTPLVDADGANARVLVEPSDDDPTTAWLA